MATVSSLKNVKGTATADFNDSVVCTYEVSYDTAPTNFYSALAAAQAATGTPVPARRSLYAGTFLSQIFVTSISGGPTSVAGRILWQFEVTFSVPPEGELNVFQYANPLDRPAVYNVTYMDREYVIEKAYNVEALSHGNGAGGNRAALTLGAIMSAAGERLDEPHVDTERLEVLVIQKNYASLADIVLRNRTFKRTTNSDILIGYQVRTLKYMLTESLGIQFENGIEFWPGVTTIVASTTTDLSLDNHCTKYWDGAAISPIMKNGVNIIGTLKQDGTQGIEEPITWRYLTGNAYLPLIS